MDATRTPGKLAGRFPIDINSFDPRATSLHNPFEDLPLGYDESSVPSDPLPFNNVCNHNFTIKPEQTLVDLPADRPDGSIQGSNRGKVGAICQKCNWHLDVKMMWTQEQPKQICPTESNPMHFFVVGQPPVVDAATGRQAYYFHCETCETMMEICYRPPRLTHDYYDLLINPAYLQARAEVASRKDSNRQGIEPQPGIKVLEALSSYLNDALLGKTNKGIPAHNKRFMTSFGDDCVPLLDWLGFVKLSPEGVEDPDGGSWAEHETWMLPQVQPASSNQPFKNEHSNRVRLDDIMEELWAQMRRMPAGQITLVKHPPPALVPADPSIARLLGADSYSKATGVLPRGRRPVAGTDQSGRGNRTDDDCYEGLGIVRDFSTGLVMFAFRKQAAWLPQQAAFFYDCVVKVSERRLDEEINIGLATLASEGYVSREEIREAYRYLGFIVPSQTSASKYFQSISDNDILGHFDSRLQDSSKHQESELRNKLRVIGRARGSAVIESASENEMNNEASALRWLDPTYNGTVYVADDQVIAMAVSKRAEAQGNQKNEMLCTKAVDIIATERNSDILKTWLLTKDDGGGDFLDPEEMKFNNAKRYFDIPDTQNDIDLNVLESMLHMRISDDPASAGDAQKHFEVIRERLRLLEQRRLEVGGLGFANRGDYTIPVGLTNMGNTCYLNSYLQFFYSVKPLRDLILDFEKFKIDTSDLNFTPKKVDGLLIGKEHTNKAQEFVVELQSLFKQMAAAPGPVVDPTWQLAVLALETGPLEAQAVVSARRATVSGSDNLPIVMSPTRAAFREQNILNDDALFSTSPVAGRLYGIKSPTANSSEVTLIESRPRTPDTDMEVHMGEDPDMMMLDDHELKDNEPASITIGDLNPDPMDPEAMPLLHSENEENAEDSKSEPSVPQRPPPVPPRPGPNHPMYGPLNRSEARAAVPPLLLPSDTNKNTNRMKAEAAAQQQDVDEAMGNVLFKIQCSIKGSSQPTPIVSESSSSQQQPSTDLIKDTFYGHFEWKYTDGKTDPMDEPFSAINISLAEKPENVTAGLESAFGLDEVSLDGKRTRRFRTITKAPPVFQIYLQRQYFDPTKGDAVINKHFIQLEEKIYLDRFMSADNEEVQKLRVKAWKMDTMLAKYHQKKGELEKLVEIDLARPNATTTVDTESGKGNTSMSSNANTNIQTITGKATDTNQTTKEVTKSGPELLDDTWAYISRNMEVLGADQALLDDLREQTEMRRRDIDKLEGAIAALQEKKKALFDEYKQHPYRLAAVFVHRGQGGARGGHYWIYICEFENKDVSTEQVGERQQELEEGEVVDPWGEALKGLGVKWRRYEDSDVHEVKDVAGQIFSETDPEKDGAPYFLVYVRDEGRGNVVDPLYRIRPPTPTPPPEVEEAEMDVDPGGVAIVQDGDVMDLDAYPVGGDTESEPAPPAVIDFDGNGEKYTEKEMENWVKGG